MPRGELVIVKKPKGISSDLRVTGEWAMVVRRLMNLIDFFRYQLDPADSFYHYARPGCLYTS